MSSYLVRIHSNPCMAVIVLVVSLRVLLDSDRFPNTVFFTRVIFAFDKRSSGFLRGRRADARGNDESGGGLHR